MGDLENRLWEVRWHKSEGFAMFTRKEGSLDTLMNMYIGYAGLATEEA